MVGKFFIFLVRQHVRAFCVIMAASILGFKAYNYNQPLSLRAELLVIVLIIVLGFGLMFLFKYFFVRKHKIVTKMVDQRYILQYRCSACGQSWNENNLPPNEICPLDGITLISYDPVEDRNTHRI